MPSHAFAQKLSPEVYSSLKYRHIGPEGNRVIAIAGQSGNPNLIYVGAASGGIWKSIDSGLNWQSVFDDQDVSSIGALALAPSDPNIVWAGIGETNIRSSISIGDGIYKSTDGGQSWEKCSKGLPNPPTGKIAVAYAPSNPSRIYTLIETDQFQFKGVLWRSENGGESWDLIIYDQQYHTRPHYYSRLVVSPDNENEIWFLATRMTVSLDGDKTGKIIDRAGGDIHDIWFDPSNPDRILVACDGGVLISSNHGKSWYHPDLPVAQIYHVAVDQQAPYFVYGNQQDGPTYRIPSNSIAGPMKTGVGGGEAGFTVPDYFDNNIIWSSNEQGVLTKHDLRNGITIDVQVWPETPVGRSPRDIKYRWVWCHPWILSTHTQNTLYAGSQFVHKTSDGGSTWHIISPDLTTNDTTMQVHSGGLTYDNVGVDYGTTLYALAESPLNKDVLWAGTNDGLVHMTLFTFTGLD